MIKPTTKQLVSHPATVREALLIRAKDALYNSFEPDNQSKLWYEIEAALAADGQHSDLAAQLLQVQVTLEKARKFVRGRHSTISYGPMQLVVEIDIALRLLVALRGDQP